MTFQINAEPARKVAGRRRRVAEKRQGKPPVLQSGPSRLRRTSPPPLAPKRRSRRLALRSEILEIQRENQTLRSQLARLANRTRSDVLHRLDRAETLATLPPAVPYSTHSEHSPGRRHTSNGQCHRRPLVRQDVYYSDGGQSREWLDPDDPDDAQRIAGTFDDLGTRRYTVEDHYSDLPHYPSLNSSESWRSST